MINIIREKQYGIQFIYKALYRPFIWEAGKAPGISIK